MPIVFEEINAEVAPERSAEPNASTPPQTPPGQSFDPAEILRRELTLAREREHRLIAD